MTDVTAKLTNAQLTLITKFVGVAAAAIKASAYSAAILAVNNAQNHLDLVESLLKQDTVLPFNIQKKEPDHEQGKQPDVG